MHLGAILAGLLLVPKAHDAIFGALTESDISHITFELRGSLVQIAIALIAFREPVGWKALYAILPSLFLRYLHSIAATRSEDSKLPRTKLALLLGFLHVCDVVWAHFWGCKMMKEKGYNPLSLAFFADIAILWGQLINYTGNFFYPRTKTQRYVVEAYSYWLRLLVYLSLVGLMASHWYLPVHIAKDAYQMVRKLVTHFARSIRYKRAFKTYKIRQIDKSEICCPICFETGTALNIEAACGHHMHLQCLYQWLEINPTCPICRTSLATVSKSGGDSIAVGVI